MPLAQLAVATNWQGKGLGAGPEIEGIRAFAVHAKDDAAKAFYLRFDFEPSPSDPYHIYRLMKDVRAVIAGDGPGAEVLL